MKSGPAKGAKKPPPFGGAARKDRGHQGRKPGPKGGRAKGGHRRHPAGGRTIGGKKTGGKTAGGKTAGGTVSRGITAILDADICGGMLFVITPLYRMRIRSPGRNRRASGVFTRIVCRVSRSSTSRRSHCTSITTACMSMHDTSYRHITGYADWRQTETDGAWTPGKGRGVQRKGPWRRYVEKRLQGREGVRSSLPKKPHRVRARAQACRAGAEMPLGYRRESSPIRLLRRHVRRSKRFSACKCARCPP